MLGESLESIFFPIQKIVQNPNSLNSGRTWGCVRGSLVTTQKLWRLHLTQIAGFLVSLESLEALFVVHLFFGKAMPDIDVQLLELKNNKT